MVLIISERKKQLTAYGKQVKIKLVELDRTQAWLIEQVKKILPNKYLDTSNLYKIMTGELNSKDIQSAINQVLDINYTQD